MLAHAAKQGNKKGSAIWGRADWDFFFAGVLMMDLLRLLKYYLIFPREHGETDEESEVDAVQI